MDTLAKLITSFESASVVWKKGYPYVIHPLTDGVPRINSEILEDVTEITAQILEKWDFDAIITIEAMGLPTSATLAMKIKKPVIVVRKRPYNLDGEIRIDQSTGYSSGELYVNDISKGERVVIFDDMLSTGGTLRPLVSALNGAGVTVVGALMIAEKADASIREQTHLDIPIRTIVRLDVGEDGLIKASRGNLE